MEYKQRIKYLNRKHCTIVVSIFYILLCDVHFGINGEEKTTFTIRDKFLV